MPTDRTLDTLRRIAAVLDVPAQSFLEAGLPPEAHLESLRQTTDLLEAFEQVTDPQARRDCIAFVRARRSPLRP